MKYLKCIILEGTQPVCIHFPQYVSPSQHTPQNKLHPHPVRKTVIQWKENVLRVFSGSGVARVDVDTDLHASWRTSQVRSRRFSALMQLDFVMWGCLADPHDL